MARDEFEPQDPRSTRATRRDQPTTDRLSRGADAVSDPLNPDWRSDRATRRGRASRSMPFTRQEFALWLQYGGWRFILAAIAILVVGAALYLLSQPGPGPLPQAGEEPAAGEVLAPTLPALGTVTPLSATLPPAPTTAPSLVGQQFRVTGTGAEGLFLRPEPASGNAPLKTLIESSVVTVIGEPTEAEGRTWYQVRDEAGSEGWAAAEFLKPAQ